MARWVIDAFVTSLIPACYTANRLAMGILGPSAMVAAPRFQPPGRAIHAVSPRTANDRSRRIAVNAPKQVLSLFDGVAITVGIVVGAGIFSLPSFIAGGLPDQNAFLLVWLAGGVVSL